MSSGIPRTHEKVVKAARKLGYEYAYATGGHLFYVNKNPNAKLGQQSKLTIPSEIKGIKTLYNILDGMGYFEAYGLGHDGQPRAAKIDLIDEKREAYKKEAQFVSLTREWKKAMKQFNRGVLPNQPGPSPRRQAANSNTP